MNGTLGRVSLAAVVCVCVAGAASARESDHGFKGKGFGKSMAMPRYDAGARVSGPAEPYAWPVADRYRPVSKPYYGRAY